MNQSQQQIKNIIQKMILKVITASINIIMNNKSVASSIQYSRLSEGASMIERMKEEADYYTRMEQLEKHQRENLNTIHDQLNQKVKALKLSIASLEKDCEMGNDKRANIKIKNLMKDTQINDKKKNDTLGDIDKLKKVIDLKRQQQTLLRRNLTIAEDEIEKLRDDMVKMQNDIEHAEINSKTTQNLMIDLKTDNEEDKLHHTKKWSNLHVNLQQSKMSTSSMIGNDKKQRRGEGKGIVTDTSTILKRKLTKLMRSNKDKIKLIETYQKNMRIIEEAFNSISQATGITDIEEIEAIFIKGEQQNYGLLTYVDVLDQQIDMLTDQNKNIQAKIDNLKKYGTASRNQIRQNQSSIQQKQKIKKIDQAIANKKTQIAEFQQFLKNVQPSFQNLLISLTKSKFNQTGTNNGNLYELSGVSLNETTLDSYLDQVQGYTNQILFFKGKEQKKPNSQIFAKSLLLDDLQIKDYRKRVTQPMSPKQMMIDDQESTKQILTQSKLSQIAVKQIERYKVFGNQERLKK